MHDVVCVLTKLRCRLYWRSLHVVYRWYACYMYADGRLCSSVL